MNTKVTLRVDLALLEGVSDAERHRLLDKLKNRLTGEASRPDPEGGPVVPCPGTELLIQVQDERIHIQSGME